MSVGPVGAFVPLQPPAAASATTAAAPATTTSGTNATSGSGFGQALANGIDNVNQLQATSDQLAQTAATGDLTNVHDYMIASTQASLATQLTVAVRNKAVDAFNEIMRMPM